MQDILLDEDFDLQIVNNDVVLGESTTQHQQLLLMFKPGDLKQFPTRCVGAAGYVNDNDLNGLLAAIKTEYEKDGMTINSFSIDSENNLDINANY